VKKKRAGLLGFEDT